MSSSNRHLYFAASVACMTACLFGYSVGFIGGVLVLPSFLQHFHLDDLPATEIASAQAATVTSWLVGTLGGVVAGMPIYSKLGRKPCLFFCAVLYIIGAALQVSGMGGIRVFDIGRFINGIGVGAGTLVSPLYISEISTPASRGMLMSGYQVGVQLSALIGFWGAYFSHQVFPDTASGQYLVPTSVQLIPGIFLVIGTFLIPEAPRFLAEQSKLTALTNSISWLRNLPPSSPTVIFEVQAVLRSVNTTNRLQLLRNKSFLAEVASTPSLRRRLTVGVGLMIAQNLAGLNAINYFAPSIFQSAGFTSVQAMLFLTGLFGVTKLIAAMAFMFYFVRVRGNRFWLNLGSAVCAASMFVLAFCIWRMPSATSSGFTATDEEGDPTGTGSLSIQGILSVLCVYIFSFFFGVSLGPISWNVCGEIFPARLSAKCCAITTFTQWLFQIVVASATPRLIARVGWGTYVVYGVCCTLSLVWCWAAVPETRGVRLGREMDGLFEKTGTGEEQDEEGTGAMGEAEQAEAEVEAEAEAEEAMVEFSETTALLGGGQRRHRRSSVALIV